MSNDCVYHASCGVPKLLTVIKESTARGKKKEDIGADLSITASTLSIVMKNKAPLRNNCAVMFIQ